MTRSEEIAIKYAPLAKRMASMFYQLEYDDGYQEAMLTIVRACQTYDPARGTLGAYMKHLMQNHLLSLARKQRHESELYDMGKEDQAYEMVLSREYLRKALSQLTHEERRLLRLKHKGLTQIECANTLNTSQASISRMLSKIRHKLWPEVQR